MEAGRSVRNPGTVAVTALVPVEVMRGVTLWVYLEGRAHRIADGLGVWVFKRVKNNLSFFGLSN